MNGGMRMEPYRGQTRDPPTPYPANQRRGRSREQDGFSQQQQQQQQQQHSNYHPNQQQQYPEQQHRRSHSADARPQYHTSSNAPNNNNINGFFDASSTPFNTSSYREGHGFSSSTTSRGADPNSNFDSNFDSNFNLNRARSDVGAEFAETDPLGRFYQLPRYEAVVHDDSILYSSRERRHYKGNTITVAKKVATATAAILPEPRRYPTATRNAAVTTMSDHDPQHPNRRQQQPQQHQHPPQPHKQSLHEQERQYYDFAKEHLITFGGFTDAQTASTGLSQEELLQRTRREQTREKKRRNKPSSKNRLINFPSGLLKAASNHHQNHHLSSSSKQQQQQQSRQPQNQHQQQQTQYQPPSSDYQKLGTGFTSLESNSTNSRRENVYESRGNKEGIRESMVRRIRNKAKKSQNHSTTTNQGWADNWANGGKKNHTVGNNHGMNHNNSKGTTMDVYEKAFDTIQPKDQFDRFMENPNLLLGNAKNEMYYDPESRNMDHDYLVVQPTIRGRSNTRPKYAEFTPRSGYSPRDLFVSEQHQHYTKDSTPSSKDSSPTSVMDMYATTNSAGVRWNQELTQQEFILTPQSTKLRPDSDEVQFRNSSGKPKSILRSRYSSSYGPKVQMEDRPLEYQSQCPSDDYPVVPERGFSPGKVTTRIFDGHGLDPVEVAGMNSDFPTMMGGFVDDNGRDVSPIGKDRQGDAANGKFPESYVQFIEAVASVVIQTKVRQKLAKNKVRKMRNERFTHHQMYQSSANPKQYQFSENEPYQSSETKMTPMVRKSYELARKVRQGNDTRKPRGRQNVALDFYALAAIQIQAAYRGWWVRDCLAVDNFCAILIQKTYRGSRCRNEASADLHRVVKVQSVCRRWMAMDAAVTRIYCVVRIQAIMRGALTRNRMMYDFLENYHAAATTIQTFWRRFRCEMTFWRAYEDILVVQSIARGWIARRRFQSRLNAKTSKFSQRLKSDTRRKFSKLPSKSQNSGSSLAASNFNHADFMKRTLSPGTFSRPSTASKMDKPYSESRETNSQLKSHNEERNSNKGIRTLKKFSPKPVLNSLKNSDDDSDDNFYNKLRKQTVKSYGGKAVSASRADIEKRRKSKEHEAKTKREEENRRLEIQAADMADLENRRKKMASKAAAREKERLAAEQVKKSPESINDSRTKDVDSKTVNSSQRTFVKNGKTPNKSDPVTTDDKEGRIPVVASEKGISLVAKRMQELKISNRNDASPTKHIVPAVKTYEISEENTDLSRSEPKNQVLKRTNIGGSANQEDMQKQVLKRTNISSSAYQKDMQNLRSESEQRRIDGMHYIFQQAGLLFSPTEDSIPAAKAFEIREEDSYRNKSEGKVHSKKEVLPRGNTQTGIIDSHEMKKIVKRDSHPDQIASRSEPKKQVLKETNIGSSETKSQVLKRTIERSSEPKNQVLKRTNTSSSAYQKDMQNLRSESEQTRIDGMHYIFQQAGLLPQKSSVSAAKAHEMSEEDSYRNKSEGKVHSKKEVLPTGSTQLGKVYSKKEVLPTVTTQNRNVRSNKEVLPTASTQTGKVHSKREALPTGTEIGIADTREIKKTDEKGSHPDPIASRSEPKNHVVKRTNTSSSAYQKDMQNLRSESEQRRIDGMHNIFQQAGLLCRVK